LAPVSAYEIRRGSELRGCFLLAQAGAEIRLADLRIPSEIAEEWSAAIALALQVAANSSAAFMTASASLPLLKDAIRANRLRWFQADPVYLYDPQACFAPDDALHITPFDGDQAYL
jgi:hypothetical protein